MFVGGDARRRRSRCCPSITAPTTDTCRLPHILASAIAARTKQLAILLAAVPITFWDPVRLAEEISVLDIISKGRVSYAFGIGHRAEEYEHFGIDMHGRGKVADESLALLRRLLAGDPSTIDGRRIHVTPAPATPGGPYMLIAGGSRAAARRAAKYGLGFISQTDSPALKEFYESECRANGHEPGVIQFPDPGAPTTVFVADDVDAAWEELGPYLLHDAVTAASYRHGDDSVASISRAESVAGAARGARSVPNLHDRRGGRLHPRRQTASAASAVRWRPARRCMAVPGTRRHGGRACMTDKSEEIS